MSKVDLKLIEVGYLQEIFQSLGIKFAFVNKDYEQVSVPCKCRDFLGDCIWAYKTKKVANIYSFKYDYKKSPYDLDTLRLSLAFPDMKSKIYFINNLHKLDELNAKAGCNPIYVLDTQLENTLIIEADKAWQSDLWKISLFTYYIKIFSYRTLQDLESPEDEYALKLSPETAQKLLEAVTKDIQYKLHDSINMAHNFSGFISLVTNKNNEENYNLIFGGA